MLDEIERARRYIAKCPPAISGQGGDKATFCVAMILIRGFALSELDALGLLIEWNSRCVPPWCESDLVRKIKSAAGMKSPDGFGYLLGRRREKVAISNQSPLPKVERVKAEFRPTVLNRIAGKVSAITDVIAFISERSPVRVETQDSASVLRRLYRFGSGEKVLIFSTMKSQGQLLWEANQSDVIQNRHLPYGRKGVWFLPQPVDGEFHPNPREEGRLSRRSEESVTAWRYAVLESDKAEIDDWLRCLITGAATNSRNL